MKIQTRSEIRRLDRVFHNVVHAIERRVLPTMQLRETSKFSITGGTIKSLEDESGQLIVSLVDELRYDESAEKFLPPNEITVYASKHDDGRMKPVRQWKLDPEKTEEIAFVIAYFFLGHNHQINRHFSTAHLRDMFHLSVNRVEELMK
ncbi:hypothetical protein [Burkholderia phage FLC9]|nr:hypothetical protein [Burkholderia phage FLC9]